MSDLEVAEEMEWEKEASDEFKKDYIPLLGPKDDQSREASQFGEEYADGNENAIKSKPAGLGGTPSRPAIKYAYLVPVVGRDFLISRNIYLLYAKSESPEVRCQKNYLGVDYLKQLQGE